MRAIKEARKFIERKPANADAQTLSRLVLALESEADFPITDLYLLDLDQFKLALEILDEWRLDRHYASKSRLFDVSSQLAALKSNASAPASAAPAPAVEEKAAKQAN
ncbi:hypothetical protein [Ottowia thiooxydans]|uniref:hypothetical protein n=1 Tax=Ottowia thiooxydans TaxID=219182 RepID=UPI0003F68681|nr:hypothetical protein [Ottowia thiooxydans]